MASSKQLARLMTASAVALLAAVLAPSASALSVTVAGGLTEDSIGSNDFFADGMDRTFLVGPLTFDLQGASAATATYTFLFQESGFSNQFASEGATLVDPVDLFKSITTYAANGAADFSFVSPLGTVTNAGNSLNKPNFGVLLDYDLNSLPAGPVRTALQSEGLLKQYSAILFLNDSGSSQDKDFDDMVLGVNLAAVPEPGTYAIMLAGLLAVFGVARRRMR